MSPDAKPSPGRGRRSQDGSGWRQSRAKRSAVNDPGTDHQDAAYWSKLMADVDAGNLDVEDVDR